MTIKTNTYLDVNIVDKRALVWVFSLLRYIWAPFSVSILSSWLVTFQNIAVSTLLAYAFSQTGNKGEQSAVLPAFVVPWLPNAPEYIPRTLFVAIVLITTCTATKTLQSLTGTWMHIQLNAQLTPAAIAAVLRPNSGGNSTVVDPATAVQRWLLKTQVVDFFFDAVVGFVGSIVGISVAVAASFRVSAQGGIVCIVTIVLWLVAAAYLGFKTLMTTRLMARKHEDVGRVIRTSAALRHDLSRPSWQRFWLDNSNDKVNELGKGILAQGLWRSTLFGVLSLIASVAPSVAVLVTIPFSGAAAGIAILLYMSQLGPELSRLAGLLPSLQDYLIAVQRVFDAFSGVGVPAAKGNSPAAPSEITITNLNVSVDADNRTLRFPDLSVGRGELLVVLGPSGSGKSTLLMTLVGQKKMIGGQVALDGHAIDVANPEWLEACAFLPQEPQLLPGTLEDNLYRFPSWSPTQSISKIAEALFRKTAMGRETFVNSDTLGVSVGQRRALALLRCLGSDAPILLLDEPVAGIDQELTDMFNAALSEALSKSRIIIATMHKHDLIRLGVLASRTTILDDNVFQDSSVHLSVPSGNIA